MGGSAMRSSRLGATQGGVGANDHRVRSQDYAVSFASFDCYAHQRYAGQIS